MTDLYRACIVNLKASLKIAVDALGLLHRYNISDDIAKGALDKIDTIMDIGLMQLALGNDNKAPSPIAMTTETDEGAGKAMDKRFISASCMSEQCGQCGQPATNKVGEEIPSDHPNRMRPNLMRHNLTVYLCAEHFDNLMDRGYYRGHVAELERLKRQNVEIVNLLRRLQPCLVTSHGDNTEFTYCIPYTLNDDIREAIARASNQPETAPDRNTP